MFTPSLVLAYWICGSMAQPFYANSGRLALITVERTGRADTNWH